jgi:hypothetical protein
LFEMVPIRHTSDVRYLFIRCRNMSMFPCRTASVKGVSPYSNATEHHISYVIVTGASRIEPLFKHDENIT